MITIDPINVCNLPVSREQVGLPEQSDCGNSLLLIAKDLKPEQQSGYQALGCIVEGILLSCCSQKINELLEQMQLQWCSYPEEGFTLAVLEHRLVTVLADRLVLSRQEER